jgi:hypothetical protein
MTEVAMRQPSRRELVIGAAGAFAAPAPAFARAVSPGLLQLADAIESQSGRLKVDPLAAVGEVRSLLAAAAEDDLFDQWKGLRTPGLEKIGLVGRGHLLEPRWKLQVFFIPEGTAHPPHCHENLHSCLMVLDGRLRAREYERLREHDSETEVALRHAETGEFGPGEGLTTTQAHRNAHWFGAVGGPAVAVNFKAVGYARAELLRLGARRYLDPTAGGDGETFMAPVIGSRSAHARFGEPPS